MFRWYRNSALCVVHLAETTSLDDLAGDEWLERGWTLQELLAPKKMKFFSRDWEPLADSEDDKVSGSPVLTEIMQATSIPAHVICDFSPGSMRVDRKMTWAATRRTSRVEDVAYSLMGIFDVSLQVAYGEGAERAFHRLIEAIMMKGGSPTVLNWIPNRHDDSALPSSPADYVGYPDLGHTYPLDMALTSRGLRIPLIILPLTVVDLWQRPERDSDRTVLRFRCSHLGMDDISISTFVNVYSGSLRFGAASSEFALGIFNYMPSTCYTNPALPRKSVAYLLARTKTEQIVPQTESFQADAFDELASRGWKRVRTKEFITVHLPLLAFDTHRYIDCNHLETVYL